MLLVKNNHKSIKFISHKKKKIYLYVYLNEIFINKIQIFQKVSQLKHNLCIIKNNFDCNFIKM